MSEEILHSNRFKRLRWIAKRLAADENVLIVKKVRVGSWVPDIKNGQKVLVNPRAKSERKRYAHHYVETVKIQPFWQNGCAKRVYKDMKREGWGGTLENLERLVSEVIGDQALQRV